MSKNIELVAEKILQAYESRIPIDFIRNNHTLDENLAYDVQDQLILKKCKLFNEQIAGYKISMTSPETQALADTHEPAYGTLTSTNLLHHASKLSLAEMNEPLVEPELMFVLTNDLSLGAQEDEIIANSTIAAGLEIPDSRYKNWFPNFNLTDLLCDNGVTGHVVLSSPIDTPNFDRLGTIHMDLYHNGKKINEGLSATVLSNPASSVAWLTSKLAQRNVYLKKGMVISSGTFISPVPVEIGTYNAIFTNIGEVRITFEP
ncbi:2-keto-4-pentenoate hydratase [Virgibacillus salexigens]|uniref:2-hydroxyhexa-2,4-dienoate hydratase n=3 Tax=Virgibacillus TaxID=84406 RepID=A0A024QEB0_9BACI|nr:MULTISPECIES: 2-keto-4-pentenoate hydratase [Virgibacillus]MYL42680.1 2-keto-4-pentenoate hydratase [Virgibacillus massiliensis]GGJ75990.1 2-keto-4-pentenoate hydratase [Virgibacillus kapii]CDQ40567.1 2-hydroxyhexa-2,4-dienoate hydratase [Virgibacillus massiliensis]